MRKKIIPVSYLRMEPAHPRSQGRVRLAGALLGLMLAAVAASVARTSGHVYSFVNHGPLAGTSVTLVGTGQTTSADADGSYEFTDGVGVSALAQGQPSGAGVRGTRVWYRLGENGGSIRMAVHAMDGRRLGQHNFTHRDAVAATIPLHVLTGGAPAHGTLVVSLDMDGQTRHISLVNADASAHSRAPEADPSAALLGRALRLATTAATVDTLVATLSGYDTVRQAVTLGDTTADIFLTTTTVASKLEETRQLFGADAVHLSAMVPCRDGVRLATDIFLPSATGSWPVVFMRTAYSRWDKAKLSAPPYTDGPYAFVVQNLRGEYGSEGAGTFYKESFSDNIDDGYDAVAWLEAQPWCNGRIGMIGGSGNGFAALNAMLSNHPALVAVCPGNTGINAYLHWTFYGGVRRKTYDLLAIRAVSVSNWPRPTVRGFDMQAWDAQIDAAAAAVQDDMVYTDNSGWFDIFTQSALDLFEAYHDKIVSTVVIAPRGHSGTCGPLPGGVQQNYPNAWPSVPSTQPGLPSRLLNQPDDPAAQSMLHYYVLGDVGDPQAPGKRFEVAATWPVPHRDTSLYLAADGSLSATPPTMAESLSYRYDPQDPAPSLGGNYSITPDGYGPHDQRPLYSRGDVLRFVSEPLAEPLTITGRVWVELYISTDVEDAAIIVKLVDVYRPSGYSDAGYNGYEALMLESAYLARYWQGLDTPARLQAGQVVKLPIDLHSIAISFAEGHRIGLIVTSSSTPAFEVHPNTYGPVTSYTNSPVAKHTIHMAPQYPSRVILPVAP